MVKRHQWFDQFMATNDASLAADALVGILAAGVVYLIVWRSLNRGWGDQRKFMLTLVGVTVAVLVVWPNAPFEFGKLLRGMFMGSLPAVGWLSFGVLVVFGGFAWGYNARAAAPQAIRTQPEPRPAVTRDATSWPKPLPKAAPEPARLTRLATPPAVPLEYRREAMPVVRNRGK